MLLKTIWDRILPGKMERFIADNTTLDMEQCLLDQSFIKDEKKNVAQYVTTYDFNLNDGYDGGDIEIYDIWLKNDRETYSLVRPKVGECLIYKPYQHITQKEITKNTKYQILVMVKNKELKKNLI